MPSTSLEDSSRSVSVSDADFFQIIASVLGLRACEILHVPFKSGVSVSYGLVALLYASSAGLQDQMFWGLVSLVQDSWAGKTDVRLGPITPWEELLQL